MDEERWWKPSLATVVAVGFMVGLAALMAYEFSSTARRDAEAAWERCVVLLSVQPTRADSVRVLLGNAPRDRRWSCLDVMPKGARSTTR